MANAAYDIFGPEKVSNVSFGTTQNRQLFPTKMAPNRFGNELVPIKGSPETGPGCYNNEDVNNFEQMIKSYKTSNKGYTMGARTGPRFYREFKEKTPCPTEYQQKAHLPVTFQERYKPFGFAADRFPVFKRDLEEVTPGAGTYEHDVPAHRKVQWHSAFGGRPINLPQVEQHSTIAKNTDKLLSTVEAKKYQRRLAYLKLYY